MTSSRRKSCGERETVCGTTTSRPPYSNAPQSSHTEKSNAYEWNNVHTSSGLKPNHCPVAESNRTTLLCGITTPFGFPVEPDV